MKSIFVGFALFFMTLTSSAASFIQVRSEEARWVVEVIEESEDGWPEIRARYTYPTKEEAYNKEAHLETTIKDLVQDRTFFNPQTAATQLWVTKEVWSQQWEQKYSDWIEAEVDRNFFLKHKIPTDCADVAYALRWIFSRMHGLPMASKLGSLNTLMTNLTVRPEWARLPTAELWHQDQRFIAALNYVTSMTYTHTLWDDSYPVALDRNYFISGTYHLSIYEASGHTQVVRWLGKGKESPFLTLNSTVPREVRALAESIFMGERPEQKKSAFLRFRWAVQVNNSITLKKSTEMPGYSLEQFSFKETDGGSYVEALLAKLGYEGGREGILQFLLNDLVQQFEIRKELVTNGYEKCQTINCEPGTQGWEDWSTPTRDSRILSKIQMLDDMFSSTSYGTKFDNSIIVDYEQQPWTGKSIAWNWRNSAVDSDPRVLPLHRWGAGYESWLKKQTDYLAQKLNERSIQLEKAKAICEKQNCNVGTQNFETLGSHKIDQEIYKRVAYLIDMERTLPSRINELLQTALSQEVFSIKGQSIKLDFLLKKDLLLNASPAADHNTQWGLNQKRSLFRYDPNYGGYPYFKKWTVDEVNSRVFLVENDASVSIPGRITLTFKNNPILLLWTNQGYFLFHLETGKSFKVPYELTLYPLLLGDQDRVIAKNNYETLIFKLSSNLDSLELEAEFEGASELLDDKELLIVGDKTYDIGYQRFYDIQWNINTELTIHSELILYNRDSDTNTVLIHRKSGDIQEVSRLSVMGAEVLGRQITQSISSGDKDKTRVIFLNHNYKVVYDEVLDGYCSSQKENYLQCYDKNLVSYERKGDQLVAFRPSERISALNTKYYIKLEYVGANYTQGLFSRESNQLLLKAHRIFQISDSLVGVKTHEEGSFHILDVKTLKPIYTNFINAIYLDTTGILGGYLFSRYTGQRTEIYVLLEDE